MALWLKILFTVLLPPLGAFFQVGVSVHFFLSILLTLLGYFPGLIHGIWLLARNK